VALMRHGEILLTQPADAFFQRPAHAYAKELLAAIPSLDKRGQRLSHTTDRSLSHQPKMAHAQPLLRVQNLSIGYTRKGGFWPGTKQVTPVVTDVSFDLFPGETLALLGESGCGKTTIAKTLMRLIDGNTRISGQVLLDGHDALKARGRALWEQRRRMQIVFQDPFGSLDPRMLVGDILDEGLKALRPGQSRANRQDLINRLLDRVG